LELLAHRALVSAYFVVARRGKRKERLRSLLLSTAGTRFPTLAADDKAEWLTI
jgi:hypothetical protein